MFSCQLLGHKSQYSTNMRSCFLKLFLVTRSETAGLRPLGKRCSKASFSVLSQIYAKMWKAIFTKFFLILETKRLFHNLFLKRCSKACICGNKPNQTKNMRSYFCLAVLITWCRAAFSQPLIHGVPEVAPSKISRNFAKFWEVIFVNSFLFLEADHFCHNLLFWLELAKINRLKCV